MPNGNVGTPTMHFMDLIKQCQLPPSVIKKLGLTFPKTKSNKKYGTVSFNYGGDVVSLDDTEDNYQVCTAAGHEIPEYGNNHSFNSKSAEIDTNTNTAMLNNKQSATSTLGNSDQQTSKKKKSHIDKEIRRRMDLRIEEKMIGDQPESDEVHVHIICILHT